MKIELNKLDIETIVLEHYRHNNYDVSKIHIETRDQNGKLVYASTDEVVCTIECAKIIEEDKG